MVLYVSGGFEEIPSMCFSRSKYKYFEKSKACTQALETRPNSIYTWYYSSMKQKDWIRMIMVN